MKKEILMFVFNDLSLDSRVQRSAEVLANIDNLTVISYGKNEYKASEYENIELDIKNKSNIIRYFVFVKEIIKHVLGRKKYDLVYAHDFFSALPMLIIKTMNKSNKFVYDGHELFIPEKYKKFSKRDYFFYIMEKQAIKNADLVISADDQRSNIMKEHYKLKEKPITIRNISLLPQKHDNSNLNLNKCNEFFSKEGITIVYSGVISKDRKIDRLVDAVNSINGKYKLLLIGYGDGVESIRTQIDSYEDNNILYLGKIPYSLMSPILKQCDIGFLSYPSNGLNNIYCAPNKIFEYASVDLPMVASYNRNIEEQMRKYDIGVCKQNIKEAIEEVGGNLEFYRKKLRVFLEDNSWEKESNILREQILNLL
jgi:glycosyltransferase involved in cell wall biosynthesis